MKYWLLSIGLFLSWSAPAQSPYPAGYFRNPLNIPIILAGNFGECRPGHFHSGMDIKTLGKENQPVYAAADGYISRIKIEKGGFGHALYITHPNGYTTLYAHLNNFVPELQQYLRNTQYKQEKWQADISLQPSQFPVKKGQQIAWSGNTGASTAPHLHFEIRNTETEHPLNPQQFGFEVKDTRPPLPQQLAVYDRSRSIYEQDPEMYTLRKKGDIYAPAHDTVRTATGIAGLALDVNDYMDGSDNTITFYTAAWYMDDALQGRIRLDDIGYDETRYMHAYADYKTKQNGGPWLQCLFRLPGNKLGHIYEALNDNSGALALADTLPHAVRIELTDDAGNMTTVRFYLQGAGKPNPLNCAALYRSDKSNSFTRDNISFVLDDKQLYDDICFSYSEKPDAGSLSLRHQLGTADVPVHHYFDISIRPDKPIPFTERDKIAMVCNDGKDDDGKAAAKTENGWYKASFRSLGNYRLVADTEAPQVTPRSKEGADLAKAKALAFTVKDNITSVKTFRAELENGQWLLFEPRGDVFIYTFDAHCPKGAHKLKVIAADENGNSRTFVYSFRR